MLLLRELSASGRHTVAYFCLGQHCFYVVLHFLLCQFFVTEHGFGRATLGVVCGLLVF